MKEYIEKKIVGYGLHSNIASIISNIVMGNVCVSLLLVICIKKILSVLHLINKKKLPDFFNAVEILRKASNKPIGFHDISHFSYNLLSNFDLIIIIPAYNVEDTIERAVNSTINQITDFRVLSIVVNDGSTDSTKKILHKYTNNSKVFVLNQENKGLSGARNTALDFIKKQAKYIFFS